MTLILVLPSQLCTFLASGGSSLPLLSHLSFPPILVVGPRRSLLSPGPLVTIKLNDVEDVLFPFAQTQGVQFFVREYGCFMSGWQRPARRAAKPPG